MLDEALTYLQKPIFLSVMRNKNLSPSEGRGTYAQKKVRWSLTYKKKKKKKIYIYSIPFPVLLRYEVVVVWMLKFRQLYLCFYFNV